MTKFTKAEWSIEYMPGATITRKGYQYKSFGIHKQGDYWCVDHLRTGLSIDLFRAKSLAVVKAIVAKAEDRFNWSEGKDVYELASCNGLEARAFHDACRDISHMVSA